MKRLLFLSAFILLICSSSSASENGYTIITSDRVKDSAKILEQGIQNIIGNLEARELSYNSAEAKAWIEKLDIKMIPYVIFDKDIAQNDKFIELAGQKMIVRKNGEYVIPDAMLVPAGVMLFQREYKPKQLEIFVMSQCPYGNTALAQIGNYMEKNPGAFNVSCHYITTFREFGIDSLHGPEEIKEDINQLLIQEKYPDRFWGYIKERQGGKGFEDACVVQGINSVELANLKEQGIALLEKDSNLCKELGISSSPTFLWENQIFINSIEMLRQFLPETNPASEMGLGQALNIIVFHSPSCPHCRWLLDEYIPELKKEFGERVIFEYYDTSIQENFEKKLNMEREFGVVGSVIPEVFVEGKALLGRDEIEKELRGLIEKFSTGSNNIDGIAERAIASSGQSPSLLERFKLFSPFAVAGAGFLDGINPCAFSTIVFFFSFLAFIGFNFRYMALAGISFTLAVFLTYLGLGLGAFMGLKQLSTISFFSRYFDTAVGGLAIILGIMSLYDYIYFKISKKTDRMALKLPQAIKNAIHKSMHIIKDKDKGASARPLLRLLAIAFIVGVLVSLLESVCTGQIYLPTLTFILKMKVMWGKAFSFLLLYNLMFILPLVIVFIVSLYGVNSQWWAKLSQRNLGRVKFLTAVLFFGMGLFILLWK